MLRNLQVILIYLGIKFAIKRFKKDKLSAIDFKKYENYYREILQDYSPAELSYIDNFEILLKNDMTATLLSLELDKKISLDDDKIKMCSNEEQISENKKYVLDNIKDGKIDNFNENEFITKVQKDAVKNGLLKESKIEWRRLAKVFALFIFAILLIIFVCAFLFKDLLTSPTNIEDWKLFIIVLAISLIFYLPVSIGAYFYTYIAKSKKNNYVRTNKGEEVNERLEGLKNYLKDFSLLDEKNEKDITLWEDYLIYSAIFNQNTKVVKSVWDKYINL